MRLGGRLVHSRVHPVGRWVHPMSSLGSLGSLGCALGVVWFFRGRWFHSRAPLGSFGLLGFTRVCAGRSLGSSRGVGFFRVVVGFTPLRSWVRWVQSGRPWLSLGSLSYALYFVTFIRGQPLCSLSVSVGSLGCARGVIRVRNGGLWVDHGSLGSLKCTLGVVRFIQGRCFHLCAQRLIQGRCVHLDAPLESLGSSGVVRFTRVRSWGSSGAVRFSHVRPWVCWVHLGIVRFIRGQCFHSCAP